MISSSMTCSRSNIASLFVCFSNHYHLLLSDSASQYFTMKFIKVFLISYKTLRNVISVHSKTPNKVLLLLFLYSFFFIIITLKLIIESGGVTHIIKYTMYYVYFPTY